MAKSEQRKMKKKPAPAVKKPRPAGAVLPVFGGDGDVIVSMSMSANLKRG